MPKSQPTVTAPAGQSGDQATRKSSSTTAKEGEPNNLPPATTDVPPGTVEQPVVPPTFTPPPEATVQERYPNWVDPSQAELDNPARAKIYNYTNDGIANVNGQALPQVVPPGKVALVPKRSSDIDPNTGMYRVTVTTDTGKSGSGNFDVENVNMGNWRASVSDNGLGLTIQENAGGGSGGGDDNFDQN